MFKKSTISTCLKFSHLHSPRPIKGLVKYVLIIFLLLGGLAPAFSQTTTTVPFTSTSAFNVPPGVTKVSVQLWGGGGGGGGADSNSGENRAGGGGAGGSYTSATNVTVIPGAAIAVTIGSGGTGGNGTDTPSEGATGGTTSFGPIATPLASAVGGAGGGIGAPADRTGNGAVTTTGTTQIGGAGGEAPPGGTVTNATGSGAGGGSGGAGGAGGAGSGITAGTAGAGGGGAGAAGLTGITAGTFSIGNSATEVGGGGSGGWDNLGDNNTGSGSKGGDGFKGHVIVTYVLPNAFTVGAVTPTGGTFVAGFWNSTNTGINISVPIANNALLTGGTIQLQGKISSGTFANLGSAVAIAVGDLNTTKIISLTDAQFEGIASFADGTSILITAIITDNIGNSTTGTQSASTIQVDQTPPAAFIAGTVSTTGGTIVSGFWNSSNTGIDIVVPIANDASLNGGAIRLQGRISAGTFADLGTVSSISSINTTTTILLTAAVFESITGFIDGTSIEITAVITDIAGNPTTGSQSLTTIQVDQSSPIAFTVGTVVATGGTIISGSIWNSTNTGVDITVPIDNDASINGGTVQLQGRISSGSFADLGSAVAIPAVNTTQTISIAAAQFEAIASFSEGSTIEIRAIIKDVAGNATTGSQSASTIFVDQASPAPFTVGSLTTTIGTVVSGHWNATNTGINIVVPIANDASLNGGLIQLQGRISSGTFANLGSSAVITAINTTQTISLTDAQFEGITSFAEGTTIQILAILTDVSGNPSTTGNQSVTTILIDQTDPATFTVGSVTVTGGNVVAGIWNNTNTGVEIIVPIANDATLNGGFVQLQGRVSSGTFANVGSASAIASINTNKTVSLSDTQFEGIASFANGSSIEMRAIISDAAGNSITGTQSASTILVDQSAPAAFTVGTVTASGGTVIIGRWNASNTGVDIVIPIANDASLNGGSIQLQGRISSGTFANLVAPIAIANVDLNTNKTISLTAAQFEGISSFADGTTVQITAILTDVNGNATTGTQSVINTIVDQAAPASFTTGSLTTIGGRQVPNFWNSTNTDINIEVPIANDATLNGGTVQLQARISSGSFANIGSASTITSVNTTKTMSLTFAQFEAITGFADNTTVQVLATITDVTGNPTTGTQSANNIFVDQTPPSVSGQIRVYNNGGQNSTNNHEVVLFFVSEDITLAHNATPNEGASYGAVGFSVDDENVDIGTSRYFNDGLTGFISNIDGTLVQTRMIYLESNDNGLDWSVANATNVRYVQSGTGNFIRDAAGNEMINFITPVSNGDGTKPFISPNTITLFPRSTNQEKLVFTLSEQLNIVSGGAVTGLSTSTGSISSATYTDNAGSAPFTITLLSTLNGQWNAGTTVTYTAGGNVRDIANNDMNTVSAHVVVMETTPPSIASVTVPFTSMKVGDIVTATITVANDDGDDPILFSGTIGGFALFNLANISSTSKSVQFIVTEGGDNVSANDVIPIGNIILKDAQNNESAPYNTSIPGQTNTSIDAKSPYVMSITRSTTTNLWSTTSGTFAPSVVFRITFSEDIKNTTLDAADFFITGTAPGAVIQAPVAITGTSVYDITVNSYTSIGTLGLNFVDNNDISSVTDVAGNPIFTSSINSDGDFTGPSYTIVLPEPSNNAFGLSTTVLPGTTSIRLDWQNPLTPTQAATHYLIRVKGPDINDAPGSYPSVADGIFVASDVNFNDGNGAVYVGSGATTRTFTTLLSGKTYDFEIIPLTLSITDDNRDYLFTSNPTIQESTPAAALGTITIGTTSAPSTISSLSTSFIDKNFTFKLKDDGTSPGADNSKTRFGTLTFVAGSGDGVTGNWNDVIQEAELKDITENNTVTTLVIGPSSITFTLPTTDNAAGELDDNEEKEYELRIRVKGPMLNAAGDNIDNRAFVFQLNAGGLTNYLAGSSTIAPTQTLSSIVGKNKIDVVTTQLDFTSPLPTTALVLTNLSSVAVVKARDIYGNVDLNYSASLTLSGALPLSTSTLSMTAGIATFPSTFQYLDAGNGALTASSSTPAANGFAPSPGNSAGVTVSYSNLTTITAGTLGVISTANPYSGDPSLSYAIPFKFSITDDGGAGIGDGSPTRISELKITKKSSSNPIPDWRDILNASDPTYHGAVLYDGLTNSWVNATVTINQNDITISNMLSAGDASDLGYIGDGDTKNYEIFIFLKPTLSGGLPATIDHLNFDLEVNPANILLSAQGSKILGTQPAINSGPIDVDVAAKKLVFTPQPSTDVLVNTNLVIIPTVAALDLNDNLDLDYNPSTGITITNAGGLGMINLPSSFVGGALTFPSNFQYTQIGNGQITVSSAALASNGTAPTTIVSNAVTVRVGNASTITAGAFNEAGAGTISSLATDNLTPVSVFDFDINDDPSGTPGTENDGNPTLISKLTITQKNNSAILNNWAEAIAGAILTDGVGHTVVGAVAASSITFNSMITAPAPIAADPGYIGDGLSKTYTLKIWLRTAMLGALPATIDGAYFGFEIINSGTNISTNVNGTSIIAGENENSGAANTTNVVEVDATYLKFTTPASVDLNANVSPTITVRALDVYNNLDKDFNNAITAFSNSDPANFNTQPLAPTFIGNLFASGIYTFPPFKFTSSDPDDPNVTLDMAAGTFKTVSMSGTSDVIQVVTSKESVLTFDPSVFTTEIPYIAHSSTPLTIAGFTLRDGNGATADTDNAPTNISSITFSTVGSSGTSDIKELSLHNSGGTLIAGPSPLVGGLVQFPGLSISAIDGGITSFTLRATFNASASTVHDNDNIVIQVVEVQQNGGSEFNPTASVTGGNWSRNTGTTGGTVTSGNLTPSTVNIIEVLATQLDFTTQPGSFAGINEPFSVPVVEARDANSILDLDHNFSAIITCPTAGLLTSSLTFGTGALGGKLDFTGFRYTAPGDGTLTINSRNAIGANILGVSSHVDVIHVTAIENSLGVVSTPNLKRGATDVVIFGATFNSPYSISTDPELKSFSFIFDNPYKTQTNTIFKNFRVFESTNGVFAGSKNVTILSGTVSEQQSPFLPGGTPSAIKDMVTVTFSTGNYRNLHDSSNPLTYYLMADVDPTVNIGTPKMRVQLIDGGYNSSPNTNGSIVTTQGSSTANIIGKQYSFASTRPPSLVDSYPKNGQLNVAANQSTISLTFDVGVWTLDGEAKLYDRQNNKLIATLLATNGRYSLSEPVAGSVSNPTPLTFQIPSGVTLKPDSVYYLTIEKGTFDPLTNTGKGVSDDGSNLFGGISYNGTLYFKIASEVAPKMKETEPLRYYITRTGGSINASFDQFGKAYFLVANSGSAVPTNAQIKNTTFYAGALGRDFIDIKQVYPNTQFGSFTASLTPGSYDVWMYAENDALPTVVPTTAPYGPKTLDPLTSFIVNAGSVGNPTFKITVPSGSGSLYLNNPTYTVCANSTTTLADPIIIAEGTIGEFNYGTQNFNILLPTGFEFANNAATPPSIILNGADFDQSQLAFSFLSGSVLNISFTNSTSTTFDKIIISNIRIHVNAGASGDIKRFAGNAIPTLLDGKRLAAISAVAAPSLSYTNTFAQANDFSSIGISNVVTTIPDNTIDKSLNLEAVRLIPNIPIGDYGASFFNGAGVTNDVLSLSGVALNSAFDVIMTHTDMNGCVSTKTDQYEVYDHLRAIPALVDITYGPKVCIDNPDYLKGVNAASLLDPAKVIEINSKAGYSLLQLYANIPATAKKVDTTLTVNSSTAQIIHGAVWQALVNQIPIIKTTTGLGQSYNWDYSKLLPLNPALDPYKYFNQETPNGKTYYKGGSLGLVEFTGKFQSTSDGTVQIPIRQEIEIFIPAIPVIELSEESAMTGAIPIFCEKGSDILINGYPAASAGASKGYFTLSDSLTNVIIVNPFDPIPAKRTIAGFTDNGNGTASLSPNLVFNLHKTIKIDYTYQDDNSPCGTTASTYLRIAPNPVAKFTIASAIGPNTPISTAYCEGVPITFDGACAMCSSISSGNIKSYQWNFNDATNSNGANPNNPQGGIGIADIVSHKFIQSASYNVRLVTTSSFGCSSNLNASTASQVVKVGAIPVAKFNFTGVSTADAIIFNNNSTITSPNFSDPIASLDWLLGDTETRTLVNPIAPSDTIHHFYNNPGHYPVNLKVSSSIGCVNEITKNIIVLSREVPSSTISYDENFEGTLKTGDWQPSSIISTESSWAAGTPTTSVIQLVPSLNGATVWKTNLNGTYNPNEKSALYSPSFDLSKLTRPMISFNSFTQIESSDGVVLEYSTDGKNVADPLKQWDVLGKPGEGVAWFNDQGITSKPGSQINNFFGWNGSKDTTWVESKHAVVDAPGKPKLTGETQVVFRFALSSVKTPSLNGFAIDNFRIGNRTRIVLLENFRNVGNTAADTRGVIEKEESLFLNAFNPSNTDSSLVKINYHVGFPNSDPLNLDNQQDPGARALYYNVSQTPRVLLDGQQPASGNPLFSNWAANLYSISSLKLADAIIKANILNTPDGSLSFTVTVNALRNLGPKTLLHVAIVEKDISLSSLADNMKTLVKTGEDKFDYVLKKLLPDAAGTRFNTVLNNGQARTFPTVEPAFTLMRNLPLYSSGNLALVMFLQDEDTKEIFQTEIVDLSDPAIVTGTTPETESIFSIYPNPADHEFTIELPQPVKERTAFRLYDQMGKVVKETWFEKGEGKKTINTTPYAGGMYLIQVDSPKGLLRRKVMVMHEN